MYIIRRNIDKEKIKEELVTLEYTRHAMDRIKERVKGSLLLYPRILRKSANNICFIDTTQMSWGYSIKFKDSTYMILVLNNTNIVKTVYFKDAKSRRNKVDKRKEIGI